MLSGGAALGYYHMGLVKSLFTEGLLPRVISGASAGSLMASIIGTTTDDELSRVVGANDMATAFRTDFFSFPWNKKVRPKRSFQYFLPQSFRWVGDWLLGKLFKVMTHFVGTPVPPSHLYTFRHIYQFCCICSGRATRC
jgi:predicted acylesterase/phospholipase RssA